MKFLVNFYQKVVKAIKHLFSLLTLLNNNLECLTLASFLHFRVSLETMQVLQFTGRHLVSYSQHSIFFITYDSA